MRIIVCGGRDFTDGEFVFDELDKLHRETPVDLLIEGGQRTRDTKGRLIGGADYWAQQWAESRGVPWMTEPADWNKWGKRAGPIRNLAMIVKHQPHRVVAFPGGYGTRDMIARAIEYEVPVQEIKLLR